MKKATLDRLLIFDLDGTLVDSAPDIIDAVNALMKERGRSALPDARIVAAIGEGLKQMVFNLFPETHADPVLLETLERDFFRHYENHLIEKSKPFAGVVEFLENTDAQIAVVTNKHERLARMVLEGLGLMRFPWVRIFGADSLERRKPDPLPLFEAMRAAGVTREQTVMIGDGIPDMVAARAAGVHAIGCLFGYTNREILEAQGASILLESYAALPDILNDVWTLPARPTEKEMPL